jgi:hypothetical protein
MVRTARFALLFAILAAPAALAHPGHVHTVMGTIAEVHDGCIEIKATTGKVASVTLNAKTKILRGAAVITAADLQVGERVVATAIENKDKTLTAKDVKVAAPR